MPPIAGMGQQGQCGQRRPGSSLTLILAYGIWFLSESGIALWVYPEFLKKVGHNLL